MVAAWGRSGVESFAGCPWRVEGGDGRDAVVGVIGLGLGMEWEGGGNGREE
jgi:hypothetical protein